MERSIGILYLCTGPYQLFWDDFYETFQKKFLPDTEKFFYVYSEDLDGCLAKYKGDPHVKLIKIDALPWPLITLLRFHYFLMAEDEIKKHDYLMFSNANIVCRQSVSEAEFLPRTEKGERFSFVQHPGYYKKKAVYNYQFERKKRSLAYIPYNCKTPYVIGAMFAGTSDAFLTMSKVLKTRIESDLKKNIIARWHDESHLNRYIVGKTDYRILSPSYCYPVGFDLPVENKIAAVDKMAKFDVNGLKGVKEEENKFMRFMQRAARRIKNEGIVWYIKDFLLMKKVEAL